MFAFQNSLMHKCNTTLPSTGAGLAGQTTMFPWTVVSAADTPWSGLALFVMASAGWPGAETSQW